MGYRSHIKPFFDCFFAMILLLILSPLLIVIYGSLFITNNGQVFFRQKRPGIAGRPFEIIKFKTMLHLLDEKGQLLPDQDRITKIGKFIRACSLDELPQLINVLKFEMSFVGPRPLLMQYLELYNTDQARRHEVKPGITGWAQVNGRNAIHWDEKFKYDLAYLEKQSFLFDLKILWLTIIQVLAKKGINQNSSTTMTVFKGSEIKTNYQGK